MDKPRVLLVDDDSINLRLFEARLISANFIVHLAQSAAEAKEFLTSCQGATLPNLIMLDIMMPDKNGFELLAELKNAKEYRHIPIIMVTALIKQTERDRAFELGADDFISKPINPTELITRARNLTQLDHYQRQFKQNQHPSLGTIFVAGSATAFSKQLEHLDSRYSIYRFKQSSDLWQYLQQKVPDLVLVDAVLASPGAYNLCQRIKSNPRTSHVPLVILDVEANVQLAWEAEANDLITPEIALDTWHLRLQNLIRQKKRFDDLFETYDLLIQRSITDPLTGLYNRNYLNEIAQREISLGQRSGRPFTFALLDIDFFKRINDQYGHPIGDKVLCDIAHILRSHVRVSDVVARYGGEEFAIVLNNVTQVVALKILERIRSAIEQHSWMHLDIDTNITLSIGVASFPEASVNIDGLMWKADSALYEAKGQGRNRVILYQDKNPPVKPLDHESS